MRPGSEDLGPEKITSNGNPATQLKLTKLVQEIQTDTSHDVDYDRIAKIRASMEAGDLQFDPDSVANALVEDIFQLP
ncbi:flagellar biosynthesis protein FlgM [Buttiauxella warmboldiae]|uniref:Flagellar biosynthesis protein FlgM n=2 Tax=Buttiauxella warmboldiae TaxID=82993 RepID=A0A3N5DUQ3_9ENTR|nr:flagellar biosynthesis protein FlgM [Buttiauxella warmboldiae]